MSTPHALGLFSLVISLMASPAVGDCSPLFDSEQLAVRAAADIYNPLSIVEDREYMGSIYRRDGKFGYTVTAGRRRANTMEIRIPKMDWEQVVALWHTHGDAKPNHRYFSETDTAVVEQFSKPFYLADYTGFLKVFRPGDPLLSPFAARRLGLPRVRGYALGEVVRDENNRTVRVATRVSRRSS